MQASSSLRSLQNEDRVTIHTDDSFNVPDGDADMRQKKLQLRIQILMASEGQIPFVPKPWQLDVASSILYGQNVLLLAGTGSGKSLSFILPGLVSRKPALILSPLNALEEDQSNAFQKWGIRAVAVNSTTTSSHILKDIRNGAYDVVITSPELVMQSNKWRPLVASSRFRNLWGVVVIDEAHCVIHWGITHGLRKAFRPAWGQIGEIRSLLSPETPMLAATATLMLTEHPILRRLLNLGPDPCIVNLGNNRPEIFMELYEMKYDMRGMKDLLSLVVPRRGDLKSTMVFFDERDLLHRAHEAIEAVLPPHQKETVAVYHALKTTDAKRDVMERFRRGEIKVLLCTEAAGMGCDIPHVELVIQWRAPKTLGIWVQRAGRAGRGANVRGHAILLVPQGFLKDLAKSKDTGPRNGDTRKLGKAGRWCGTPSFKVPREVEPVCDEGMAEWALSKQCRRLVQDRYYGNPKQHDLLPPSLCCDICRNHTPSVPRTPSPHPTTDVPMRESEHTARSEPQSPDVNGKRKMGGPQRTKANTERLLAVLVAWRNDQWRHHFPKSFIPPNIIIADDTLGKIAKHRRFTDENTLRAEWPGFSLYGRDVLDLLSKYDEQYIEGTRIPQRRTQPLATPVSLTTPTVLRESTNQFTGTLPRRTRSELLDFEGMGVFQVRLDTPSPFIEGPASGTLNVFDLGAPDSPAHQTLNAPKHRAPHVLPSSSGDTAAPHVSDRGGANSVTTSRVRARKATKVIHRWE